MKINQQAFAPPRTPSTTEGRVSGATGNPGDVGSGKVSVSTEVKLSAGQNLRDAGANGDFDAAKVESVKAAIAGGTFRVDAAVVADNLIASNLEALQASRRS